jgi:Mg2+-importing ATPase
LHARAFLVSSFFWKPLIHAGLICRDAGLDAGRVVTGAELARLSPGDFSKTVQDCNVFVKRLPAQKEQIVNELRNNGNVVGFMGDGINDVPALKAADVGFRWIPRYVQRDRRKLSAAVLPMPPIQILTNSLLYDFSQTGIPT